MSSVDNPEIVYLNDNDEDIIELPVFHDHFNPSYRDQRRSSLQALIQEFHQLGEEEENDEESEEEDEEDDQPQVLSDNNIASITYNELQLSLELNCLPLTQPPITQSSNTIRVELQEIIHNHLTLLDQTESQLNTSRVKFQQPLRYLYPIESDHLNRLIFGIRNIHNTLLGVILLDLSDLIAAARNSEQLRYPVDFTQPNQAATDKAASLIIRSRFSPRFNLDEDQIPVKPFELTTSINRYSFLANIKDYYQGVLNISFEGFSLDILKPLWNNKNSLAVACHVNDDNNWYYTGYCSELLSLQTVLLFKNSFLLQLATINQLLFTFYSLPKGSIPSTVDSIASIFISSQQFINSPNQRHVYEINHLHNNHSFLSNKSKFIAEFVPFSDFLSRKGELVPVSPSKAPKFSVFAEFPELVLPNTTEVILPIPLKSLKNREVAVAKEYLPAAASELIVQDLSEEELDLYLNASNFDNNRSSSASSHKSNVNNGDYSYAAFAAGATLQDYFSTLKLNYSKRQKLEEKKTELERIIEWQEYYQSKFLQLTQRGTNMKKYAYNSTAIERKTVFLDVNKNSIIWTEYGKTGDKKHSKAANLSAVQSIYVGKLSPVLNKKFSKEAVDLHCFSLQLKDRTIDFECESQAIRDAWVLTLQFHFQDNLKQRVNITAASLHKLPKPPTLPSNAEIASKSSNITPTGTLNPTQLSSLLGGISKQKPNVPSVSFEQNTFLPHTQILSTKSISGTSDTFNNGNNFSSNSAAAAGIAFQLAVTNVSDILIAANYRINLFQRNSDEFYSKYLILDQSEAVSTTSPTNQFHFDKCFNIDILSLGIDTEFKFSFYCEKDKKSSGACYVTLQQIIESIYNNQLVMSLQLNHHNPVNNEKLVTYQTNIAITIIYSNLCSFKSPLKPTNSAVSLQNLTGSINRQSSNSESSSPNETSTNLPYNHQSPKLTQLKARFINQDSVAARSVKLRYVYNYNQEKGEQNPLSSTTILNKKGINHDYNFAELNLTSLPGPLRTAHIVYFYSIDSNNDSNIIRRCVQLFLHSSHRLCWYEYTTGNSITNSIALVEMNLGYEGNLIEGGINPSATPLLSKNKSKLVSTRCFSLVGLNYCTGLVERFEFESENSSQASSLIDLLDSYFQSLIITPLLA
jgi:hypothetical protein